MTIVPKRPPVPLEQLNLDPLQDVDDDTREEFEQRLQESFACSSMREQLAMLRQPYETSDEPPSYGLLADIFGVSRGTIHNQIQRFHREVASGGPHRTGRPSVLSEDQVKLVIEKISSDYYNKELCTYPLLTQWLEEEHDIHILPDTLGSIIRHHQDVQAVLAPVMEDKRYDCSREAIDDYFEQLSSLANDKPACLICNLDEMGYLESQDRRKQVCIVPAGVDPKTVRVPIDRQKRRMTILQCVFADGTKLKPAVIVPRKTGERELLDLGIVPEHCLLYYQENGFMTSDIFMDWADAVLFPEYVKRLDNVSSLNSEYDLGLEDDQIRGLVIMDGLKQHFTDYFEDECFVNCIDILDLPSHSSDQTQPCDLCLFAACKNLMPGVSSDGQQNQTKDISKLVSAMHSACSPSNIRKSFKRAGLLTYYHGSCDDNSGILLCRVDTTNCTQVRHFPTKSREERRDLDARLLDSIHAQDKLAPPLHFPLTSSKRRQSPDATPTSFHRWLEKESTDVEHADAANERGGFCTPGDSLDSELQSVLEQQFPDGTDHLRTPENYAKVSTWLEQRDGTRGAPRRLNRVRETNSLDGQGSGSSVAPAVRNKGADLIMQPGQSEGNANLARMAVPHGWGCPERMMPVQPAMFVHPGIVVHPQMMAPSMVALPHMMMQTGMFVPPAMVQPQVTRGDARMSASRGGKRGGGQRATEESRK